MVKKLLETNTDELKEEIWNDADIIGEDFCLFIPEKKPFICIMSHIDTVHDNGFDDGYFTPKRKPGKPKKRTIYHDSSHDVYFSPDGVGGDDRAGIYGCLHLLKKHRKDVMVLITDGEESGGYGAIEFTENNEFDIMKDCGFIISMDRRGKNDMVYYNAIPDGFDNYIQKYGYRESLGSFSDIKHIAQHSCRAGVNLSIGFYHEHTKNEILKFRESLSTISRIENIIKDYDGKIWDIPEEKSYYGYHRSILDDHDYDVTTYCWYCGVPIIMDDYDSRCPTCGVMMRGY